MAQSAAAKKFNVVYTADEIKLRPMSDPIRQAYTANGNRGVVAYLASRP